jgi:hypothetical protein
MGLSVKSTRFKTMMPIGCGSRGTKRYMNNTMVFDHHE